MKKIIAILMAILIVVSMIVVLGNCTAAEKVPVIVMFKDRIDSNLIKQHGGEMKCTYQIYPAVAVSLPQKAIDALKKNPEIDYIVPDIEAFTVSETLGWGVDRIDADIVHRYNRGAGVRIAVMDTGIDYNHPDLAANYKGGYDFGGIFFGIIDDPDPMDFNGHGTHCAGIVAAVKGNGIGVIGVAPEVDLYGVKVFDDLGYCLYSDVIQGLEWCINNNMEVISMSFGSTYTAGDPGIEPWINSARNSGILLVGAAGNEGSGTDTVIYPARYDAVIAVAATDSGDNRAVWSSTGSDVELAAPGVGIYSTYLGNGYTTMSGTSMACPHVAGTVALAIAVGEGDVRQCLRDTADDLGTSGKDDLYGYGLVDADEAAPSSDPINELPIANAGTDQIALVNETVSLDGSGSYDPDGTITSYDWTFGDGTTGIGEITTYTYDTVGTYIATLTVTDDEGATDTDTAIVTVTETSANTMHVSSIVISTTKYKDRGWFTYATSTVKIVDANDNSVEGANVCGSWTGLTGDSDSSLTDVNGEVVLNSNSVKNAHGTFTFTIDNVVKSGWIYQPSANAETSDSITV